MNRTYFVRKRCRRGNVTVWRKDKPRRVLSENEEDDERTPAGLRQVGPDRERSVDHHSENPSGRLRKSAENLLEEKSSVRNWDVRRAEMGGDPVERLMRVTYCYRSEFLMPNSVNSSQAASLLTFS